MKAPDTVGALHEDSRKFRVTSAPRSANCRESAKEMWCPARYPLRTAASFPRRMVGLIAARVDYRSCNIESLQAFLRPNKPLQQTKPHCIV